MSTYFGLVHVGGMLIRDLRTYALPVRCDDNTKKIKNIKIKINKKDKK